MSEFLGGQTQRILLISTREQTRTELDEALDGSAGAWQVHWVTQPDLSLSRAEELVPNVILADDDIGSQIVSLIQELSSRVPGAVILALLGDQDMDRARQTVLAGARGFLTKPLVQSELQATLRQLLARPSYTVPQTESVGGHVIAFCAPKGGTGRTTVAVNTALCLRKITREPVVLVDADFSAPALDVALNLPSGHTMAQLLPRLARLDEDLVSGVLAQHASGLQVLLAPSPVDHAKPISMPNVQQILVVLRRMFPWVVVDLGLPLDETTLAFVDSADRVVMTVLPEMVGLRNTRLMLEELLSQGYPMEKVWLVVNRATIRGGVTTRDIEERLQVPVKHCVPDDQPLVTHSVNRGIPLVASHGSSAVARSIYQLTAKLIQDLPAAEVSAPESTANKSQGTTAPLRARAAAGALWRRIADERDRRPRS